MIKSFKNKESEINCKGTGSKKLPDEIQAVARRKFRMLNNAQDLIVLRISPANRLEKLKANLSDYYSIRMNDQWRIIFRWQNNDAVEVEIVDDH